MRIKIRVGPTRYNKRDMVLSLSSGYTFNGRQVFSGHNDRGTDYQAYIPFTIRESGVEYHWYRTTIIPSKRVGSKTSVAEQPEDVQLLETIK